MKEKHANHLIHETSPYLLQHAHNPVDWFAWGKEALQKAKEEDKPILVSIGYSACHWCHVMERESFEDEETASLMNPHFINIKIDREERPDLDHIYMDAVQAITGSGGWPLNVFLTPELKPFYGGTYYPPVRAFNRSSWKEVLTAIVRAYKEKRNEIEEQAENLTRHLLNANNFGTTGSSDKNSTAFDSGSLQKIAENLLKPADKEWGGFGNAPKFPQTFSILYLLRHYHFTGDEASLKQAVLSLDKMMMGGIYDHIGGGFSRYSTDKRWQIPHFEKMLYDNALLVETFTEAYQLTKKEAYADVIKETIRFIKTEMTSPEGGFYSALDADSEGVEGKYYTWSKKEIHDLVGEDSELFCSAYNISEPGNWEHTNILWLPEPLETVAEKAGLGKEDVVKRLEKCKHILFAKRQERIRPSLDDKILLGWNALMIKALCKAYAAFGAEEYLGLAVNNMSFLEKNLQDESGSFYHSWNKTVNRQQAFLDDHAALIQAYIYLHQVTFNTDYLLKAGSLTEKTIENFSDEENTLFYFTAKDQTDILVRKKEIYDGATPSGNALMAENLYILSLFFDDPAWRQRTGMMVDSIKNTAENYPTSFGYWSLNLQGLIIGFKEIVILGKGFKEPAKQVLEEYIPLKLLQASLCGDDNWPLLRGKSVSDRANIYLCENYQCLQPAETFEDLKIQLAKTFLTKNPHKQNNS